MAFAEVAVILSRLQCVHDTKFECVFSSSSSRTVKWEVIFHVNNRRHVVNLTHWGRDKMVDFPNDFSKTFSWMKMCKFRLRFHWSLFPMVQLTIFQPGSDNGLAPARRQAIIWTNDGKFTDAYMRHSASMGATNIYVLQNTHLNGPTLNRGPRYKTTWSPMFTTMFECDVMINLLINGLRNSDVTKDIDAEIVSMTWQRHTLAYAIIVVC